MASDILRRLEAETGVPRLAEVLARELSSSDLQSLLLRVYQERAANLRAPDLMDKADRPLLAPSQISARVFNRFDQVAFEVARQFEALDLAPVCSLGLSRVLGEIDQNNVLTTIRNADVMADPTPAMAVECARRRKDPKTRQGSELRLCASQRLIRLQPLDFPGYTPHFRLFGMVSAGRDTGSHAFEIAHLAEHIRFYLELCRALNGADFSFASPLVEVSDCSVVRRMLADAGVAVDQLRHIIRAHRPGESERFLADRGVHLPDEVLDPVREIPGIAPLDPLARVKTQIFEPFEREFPEAQFRFNLTRLEGLSYYTGLCLRISPLAPDGNRYPVIDGGFTDWTARLLQDRKERFLSTGIGTEFACRRYRAAES